MDGEDYIFIMKKSVTFFVTKPFRIIISRRKRFAKYVVSNGKTIKSYRNLVRKSGKQKPLEGQE